MPHGTPRNSSRALARVSRNVSRTPYSYGSIGARAAVGVVRRVVENRMRRVMNQVSKKRRGPPKQNTKEKKQRNILLTSDHTGLAVKKLGRIKLYKSMPKHGKELGEYLYQNVTNWVIDGQVGKQVTDFPEVLFTRDQLIGANLSTSRFERYRWDIDPFKLNPFVAKPTSLLYPGPHPETSKSDVLYIKNVKLDCQLLSMKNVPQEVKVYWVTPKFDTDINPLDSWNNVLNAKNDGILPPTRSAGIGTSTAASGRSGSTDVGANPFHHRQFRDTWRCVTSSTVLLQAGEQVNLEVVFDMHKILSRSTLAEVRNQQFLAGITVFPMLICRAGLAGVATNLAGVGGSATEISHAPVKVGTLTNYIIKFGALPTSRHSSSFVYPGIIEGDETTDILTTINDQDQEVAVFDQ